MNQAHIFVSGHVQGVGYRYFVKSNAIRIGLTGWVRNAKDGNVEAVFQGEQETIEKMIALCRQGPFLSDVKDIKVEWEGARDMFDNFQISK